MSHYQTELPDSRLHFVGVTNSELLYSILRQDNSYQLWCYDALWEHWSAKASLTFESYILANNNEPTNVDFAQALFDDSLIICQCIREPVAADTSIFLGCYNLKTLSWKEYTSEKDYLKEKSSPILFCSNDYWLVSGRSERGSHFYQIRSICEQSRTFDLIPFTFIQFSPDAGMDILFFERYLHVQNIENFATLHRFEVNSRNWEVLSIRSDHISFTSSEPDRLSLQVCAANRIFRVHGGYVFLLLEKTDQNQRPRRHEFYWREAPFRVPGDLWRLSEDSVPCVGSQHSIYLKMHWVDPNAQQNPQNINNEEIMFPSGVLHVVQVEVPTLEWLCFRYLAKNFRHNLRKLTDAQMSAFGLTKMMVERLFDERGFRRLADASMQFESSKDVGIQVSISGWSEV